MFAGFVAIVDFENLIALIGFSHGIERAGIKRAPFPAEMVFGSANVPLKADDVNGLSSNWISEGINHVVCAECVGDLDIEVVLHQVNDADFIVQGVAALAVGIESLDCAG